MNKILSINLGGYPVNIDEDAFQHLKAYLDTIHQHFTASEGYEEITGDIESRMAELLQEIMGDRMIVTFHDIKEAINIMGHPEEFGAEPMEEVPIKEHSSDNSHTGSSKSKTSTGKEYATGKRLFRNTEDVVLAGVASGVAAYFGVQDPIWVRIGFIVLTITTGFGLPVYAVLWAIAPKAESSSDKLSMRGEPINVSNIGKIIEEELSHFSEKMTDFGDGLNKKMGGKKKNRQEGQYSPLRALERGLYIVGSIVRSFLSVFTAVLKSFFFGLSIVLLFLGIVLLLALITGVTFVYPVIQGLFPSQAFMGALMVFSLVMFIGLPVASIIISLSQRVSKKKVSNYWQGGLWTIWSVNIAIMSILGAQVGKNFSHKEETFQSTTLPKMANDTLILSLDNEGLDKNDNNFFQSLGWNSDHMKRSAVYVTIKSGKGSEVILTEKRASHGRNNEDALFNASQPSWNYEWDGKKITVPMWLKMEKNAPLRDQSIELIIEVPEGLYVRLGKGFDNDFKYRCSLEPSTFSNRAFHEGMLIKGGVNGFDNLDPAPAWLSNIQSLKDFHSVHIVGHYEVNLTQSDQSSIQFKNVDYRGETPEMDAFVSNGVLHIVDKEDEWHRRTINIQMPILKSIDVKSIEGMRITGFTEPYLRINAETQNKIECFVNIDTLEISGYDRAEFLLHGEGKHLIINGGSDTEVDAAHYKVLSATVNGKQGGRYAINASELVTRKNVDNIDWELIGSGKVVDEQ